MMGRIYLKMFRLISSSSSREGWFCSMLEENDFIAVNVTYER